MIFLSNSVWGIGHDFLAPKKCSLKLIPISEAEDVRFTGNNVLIVIDMQNDFLAQKGYYDRKTDLEAEMTSPASTDYEQALETPSAEQEYRLRKEFSPDFIARVLETICQAEQQGIPIIFVRVEYDHTRKYENPKAPPPDFLRKHPRYYPCKKNTWGSRLIAPIEQLPIQAFEVVKHHYDGFCETDLARWLEQHGLMKPLVCGVETDACITRTAGSPYKGRLDITVLSDSVATSLGEGTHALALEALQQAGISCAGHALVLGAA